jgi:hypothetical protein
MNRWSKTVNPIARVATVVLDEALRTYRERFNVGETSRGSDEWD